MISDADVRDRILITRLSYRKLMFLHISPSLFLFFSFRRSVHCPPFSTNVHRWKSMFPPSPLSRHVLLFCLVNSRLGEFLKKFHNIYIHLPLFLQRVRITKKKNRSFFLCEFSKIYFKYKISFYILFPFHAHIHVYA